MTMAEVAVLAVEGRLDAVMADRLEDEMLRLIERGERAILLDFSKLQEISGPGLRVLLVAGKGSKRVGCQLALSGVNESVARALQASGFDRILTIHPEQSSALDALI
jgi:anti-sigma B factor antagonist